MTFLLKTKSMVIYDAEHKTYDSVVEVLCRDRTHNWQKAGILKLPGSKTKKWAKQISDLSEQIIIGELICQLTNDDGVIDQVISKITIGLHEKVNQKIQHKESTCPE